MLTDNVIGAENQQERLKIIGWIVGFIDGEGCFSVSLHKNSTTKLGWQIMPEFVATQGEKSLEALRDLQNFFKCGHIFINKRHDNHNGNLYRYCVRSFQDLKEIIIPFFIENKLHTSKSNDFDIFVKIINLMSVKKHLNKEGINEILDLATTMNTKKRKQFFRESSEAIRQTLII